MLADRNFPVVREKTSLAFETRPLIVNNIRFIRYLDTIWPSRPTAEFNAADSGLTGELGSPLTLLASLALPIADPTSFIVSPPPACEIYINCYFIIDIPT